MLAEYRIRRGTNNDIPLIKEVVFTVLLEYGLFPDESGTDKNLSDLEAFYFKGGGYFGVLVSPDDQIVGTISVANHGDGVFELKKMFLKKELRGKGFGKLMMNFILDFAKEKKCRKVFLETIHVLEEAIGLYKSYGFKPVDPVVVNNRVDQAYELIIHE